MAKMFYTLDEAASKLSVSPDEVKQMVARGQLQEFRDRDKLMFKVEQVDLLAGGKEDDIIPLAAGDLEPLSLSSSGTNLPAESPKEQTGISIFEADDTEQADPSAVTRVSPSVAGMTPGGSGLEITRTDDTSLGAAAEVLDERFGTPAAQPAVSESGGDAGALFETSPAEAAASAAPAALFAPEVYDGAGSGLVGGLSLGVIAACLIGCVGVVMALATTPGSGLLADLGGMAFILAGAALLIGLIGAGVGFVLGRRG